MTRDSYFLSLKNKKLKFVDTYIDIACWLPYFMVVIYM